jgi:anaerobic nitric oxide reductase transcription regulator
MTTNSLLASLLPLVADLARELPEAERYRRLLGALRELLPCDASALLRLVPLAVDGLSADTLGRRFIVAEHPRLQAILASPQATRFAADCELPDLCDGLARAMPGIWRYMIA